MEILKPVDLSCIPDISGSIDRISKQWMLLSAGQEGALGTMTASWGAGGFLWNRPMLTIYVRPERHTYGFIEREDVFTASFFSEEYRKQLTFCGRHSGRDVDKVSTCGFTVETSPLGGVYFSQADLVLVCQKRYRMPMPIEEMRGIDPAGFYGKERGNPHVMYIGEIMEVFKKEG